MSTIFRLLLRVVVAVVLISGVIALWEAFKTGKWFSLGAEGETQTTHAVVLEEARVLILVDTLHGRWLWGVEPINVGVSSGTKLTALHVNIRQREEYAGLPA